MKRRLLLLWIPVLLGIAADRIVVVAALGDGYLRGRRVAPFDPPLFNAEQRKTLERLRADPSGALVGDVVFDSELGWCVRRGVSPSDPYDPYGARRDGTPLSPSRRDGVLRLVVAGGSFTHGDEVAAVDSWPARLERLRADVEVANLGVGAYGIDQAYLRLERDGLALDPDEVWLCAMPTALLRCLNVYRPALRHHDPSIAFKPRFEVERDGRLVRVDIPVRSVEELVEVVLDQRAFLSAVERHDFFVRRARAAYAPMGDSPWHWFAAGRLLLTKFEGGGRDAASMLLDEGSELSRVTEAIVKAAHGAAARAGARFALVLLPDERSLRARENAGGRGFWEPWLERLRAAGVDVIDTTDHLIDAGIEPGERSWWRPGGHYSPRANQAVAECLAARLERR